VTALEVVALVAGILVFVALAFVVAMIPVRRRAKRVGAELEEELGEGIIRRANAQGLGLESRGATQVRGNGWLALTAYELRFRMWVPARETSIPIASITDVGTERMWLGKTVGSRLLRVRWRMPDGSEDAMAWNLRDLDGWLAELRALTRSAALGDDAAQPPPREGLS
jgi:hypothetical protein